MKIQILIGNGTLEAKRDPDGMASLSITGFGSISVNEVKNTLRLSIEMLQELLSYVPPID